MPVTILKQMKAKQGWNAREVKELELEGFLDELHQRHVSVDRVKVVASRDPEVYLVLFPWGI